MRQKIIAWSIHVWTALGGVIGLLALIEAARGEIHNAFLLLAATVIIDGTDGTLARAARIKTVLPNFNGAEIDNIIDFLTYVWVPAFILWKADLVPHPLWTAVPVIAALFAYGQVNMKSEDGYFIGFPSYWNFIALYLYWLKPDPVIAVLALVIPGILSFIPTRYLYPSRGGFLAVPTLTLTALWGILIAWLLFQVDPPRTLVLVSLIYPAYYMIASALAEVRARRAGRLTPQAINA